jgi:hypothetical protein
MGGVRAAVLLVADVHAAADRYAAAFELPRQSLLRVQEHPAVGGDVAVLGGDGTAELWLYRPEEPVPVPDYFPFVAFEARDLEATRARAEASGFETLLYTNDSGVGDPEPFADPLGGYYILKDPDGNKIEIRSPGWT